MDGRASGTTRKNCGGAATGRKGSDCRGVTASGSFSRSLRCAKKSEIPDMARFDDSTLLARPPGGATQALGGQFPAAGNLFAREGIALVVPQ